MVNVLLVDDDDKFCKLVVPTLELLGLDVVRAANCWEANAEVTANKFDLIILDGNLGTEDGEEWLRSIRAAGNRTDVMFISGAWRDTESYYRLINDLQVRSIVHKPICAPVFAEQVRQLAAPLLRRSNGKKFDTSGVNGVLDKIKREFTAELPATLAGLVANLRELCKGSLAKSGSFTQAVTTAHKLRGTGSSFGCDWVTDACAAIEEKLKASALSSQPTSTFVMEHLVDVAERALARAQNPELCPAAVQPALEPVAGAATAQMADRTPHILLVDDDHFFRRKAEHVLSAEGMQVTSFNDAVRLVEVIDQVNPDLLMLDVNLPGLSGYDVSRKLRQDPKWRNLPIIIITSDTPLSARDITIHAGATAYLTKPVNNARLLQTVQENLPLVDVQPETIALPPASTADAWEQAFRSQ